MQLPKADSHISSTEEGIEICFNEVQPSNSFELIFWSESGSERVVNDNNLLKLLFKSLIPDPGSNVTWFKEVQPIKANLFIVWTDDGIIKFVSETQPLKQCWLINFNDDLGWNIMSFKDEQNSNAELPNKVTEDGIVISSRELQFENV